MKRHLSVKLRQILRNNPEGMTASALADLVGATYDGVRKSLANMPDVYISHWEERTRPYNLVMVFKAVEVPPNAPKPSDEVILTRLKELVPIKHTAAPKHAPTKTQWAFPPPWATERTV